MTPEEALTLVEYNAWANHRAAAAAALLSPAEFSRDLGSSFPSVHATLVHIMGVEWLYMERWQGRSPTAFPSAARFPSLEALRGPWAAVEQEWLSRSRALAPGELARHIEFRNTRGISYSQPLAQLLQHLVNHSTYHRGQVASLLRQLSHEPQPTDLITFFRERDAATS